MLTLNSVVISGRLTQDPKISEVGEKKTRLAKFGIAHNAGRNAPSGPQRESMFIDVQVWDSKVGFVEKYLHKGDFIVVTGALRQEHWKAKNGEFKSRIVINASAVQSAGYGQRTEELEDEPEIPEIPDVPQQSRYSANDYPPPRRTEPSGRSSGYPYDNNNHVCEDGTVPF